MGERERKKREITCVNCGYLDCRVATRLEIFFQAEAKHSIEIYNLMPEIGNFSVNLTLNMSNLCQIS